MDDLQSVAVYARDRVNPYLFNYALSVAILHRTDTKDLDIPPFIQSFPDKYLDSKVFNRAREEATVVSDGSRVKLFKFYCSVRNDVSRSRCPLKFQWIIPHQIWS